LEIEALHSQASAPRKLVGGQSSSSSTSNSTSGSHSGSQSGSSSADHASSCGHPHFGNHDLHSAEVYLAWISVGILGFFLVEQVAMILELQSEYCKPMFLLDLFVIVSSLLLEILVMNMAVGGLLVLARMWRFARVGHGVFASREQIEEIEHVDETASKMGEAWDKLTVNRWAEIAKPRSDAKQTEFNAQELSSVEKEIAEELRDAPHVVLRALALARAYTLALQRSASDASNAVNGSVPTTDLVCSQSSWVTQSQDDLVEHSI